MTSTTTIRISHTEGARQRPVGGFVGALTGGTIPEGGVADEVEISIDDEHSPRHTDIEALSMAAASAYAAAFSQGEPLIDVNVVEDEPSAENPYSPSNTSQDGTHEPLVESPFDEEPYAGFSPVQYGEPLVAGAAYLVQLDDTPSVQTYIFDGERLQHPAHRTDGVIGTSWLPDADDIVWIRLLAKPTIVQTDRSASFSEDF